MGLCGTESFAGWAKTGHAGLYGPAFFYFLFYRKKREIERVESDSCDFSPIKHKEFRNDDSSSGDDDSSSGDDDSSSGDDDSSSSDDDSNSGGVLIWFYYFIIHNYELLYYNVVFHV